MWVSGADAPKGIGLEMNLGSRWRSQWIWKWFLMADCSHWLGDGLMDRICWQDGDEWPKGMELGMDLWGSQQRAGIGVIRGMGVWYFWGYVILNGWSGFDGVSGNLDWMEWI